MSDPDTPGPDDADDLGTPDPITGVPASSGGLEDDARLDDAGTADPDLAAADTLRTRAESMQTVTNDAVAGDAVEPGPGDANQGPTGGASREVEPILPDNELAGQDVDLDDEP
jgi:hypothetical protein